MRLMPPSYVKPYVKRQKNDATDAEAICEAVGRANMRFVPTKTPEQQSGLVLHRTRHLFIRQQTSVINAIRAHCAEFGIVAAGALAVIRYAKIHGIGHRPWLTALLARRPTKVAAIALANKIARMAWAMMARGERYREPVALAA